MNIEEKQKFLKEYEASLEGKTLEELQNLEAEVIADAEANDERVSKLEFDLPKENYKVVAEGIRKLLNKQTVQWQYTLGLVGMYDFWNPEKKSKKIPYAQLDSILRTLGSMSFTGYDEWSAVVAINKYFEVLHNAYVDATEATYDIASKHDIIIRKMDALKKVNTEDEKKEDTK